MIKLFDQETVPEMEQGKSWWETWKWQILLGLLLTSLAWNAQLFFGIPFFPNVARDRIVKVPSKVQDPDPVVKTEEGFAVTVEPMLSELSQTADLLEGPLPISRSALREEAATSRRLAEIARNQIPLYKPKGAKIWRQMYELFQAQATTLAKMATLEPDFQMLMKSQISRMASMMRKAVEGATPELIAAMDQERK